MSNGYESCDEGGGDTDEDGDTADKGGDGSVSMAIWSCRQPLSYTKLMVRGLEQSSIVAAMMYRNVAGVVGVLYAQAKALR